MAGVKGNIMHNHTKKAKGLYHYSERLVFRMSMILCLLIVFSLFSVQDASAQPVQKLSSTEHSEVLSRSFEMRYFTDDTRANGETDFKGETAIFDTEKRIEFLREYDEFASDWFEDPDLDQLVVTDQELKAALERLKPQPLPQVRQRIPLTEWKFLGSTSGKRKARIHSLEEWKNISGVQVQEGSLQFIDSRVTLDHRIEEQDWRMSMQWRFKIPSSDALPVRFQLGDAVEAGITDEGRYYYQSNGQKTEGSEAQTDIWVTSLIELDMVTGKYNWFIDDELVADFVALDQPAENVSRFIVEGGEGLKLDDIWGVSYRKTYKSDGHQNTRDVPFSIDTFIDEDFEIPPELTGWNQAGYDDTQWMTVPQWPYAHGGERYRGERLYLRKKLEINDFERALLSVEKISPAGKIWVNGKIVSIRDNLHPFTVDLTDYLKPNAENLIAIMVHPDKVDYTSRHTPSDEHRGWFAGRMWLDLTEDRRITDVFVYTDKLEEDNATLGLEIDVQNDLVLHPDERERKESNILEGSLNINLYKWFPQEHSEPVASMNVPLNVYLGQNKKWTGKMQVSNPDLWTPDEPKLHKLVVQLLDVDGNVIDDEVVTTGIRTVSQEGGTFGINGKPEMMNGALIFGFRAPLDRISQWLFRSPEEHLVSDILMLKKMNANAARMSIHDGPSRSTNDPRYAEIGDQLGIMYQWATTAWVRTDSPWLVDFEGLPKYIRQVRNHPSIVMWQPANHPYWNNFDDFIIWLEDIYKAITKNDRSRLISPTGSMTTERVQPRNDAGTLDYMGDPVEPISIWTAPLITRGSMDFSLGYGSEWSVLRSYPYPEDWEGVQNWLETGYRTDYLDSKERAYFDFESEETIGQPNWNLHRGKPQYRIRSYELNYDVGSIGRRLATDEWRESQAWQALGTYEAYRKKRWLDYDGLAWCPLRGGGNTATYQKPAIDYYGHAKLAFYALQMAFQPILAGSNDVDIAYGPKDEITPIVMNLGPERTVHVNVRVLTLSGMVVDEQTYRGVELGGGRTVYTLEGWRPTVTDIGSYAVEYVVTEAQN